MATLTEVEDAIHAALSLASGLPATQVVWSDQDGPKPQGTMLTLRMGNSSVIGAFDEVRHTYDETRLPGDDGVGREIEHRAYGIREFTLSVQAFTDKTVAPTVARDLLEHIQAALVLPGASGLLDAAGVSIFDFGSVLNISSVSGTAFEGRALLDMRCYRIVEAAEFGTWIGSVETENHIAVGTPQDIPFQGPLSTSTLCLPNGPPNEWVAAMGLPVIDDNFARFVVDAQVTARLFDGVDELVVDAVVLQAQEIAGEIYVDVLWTDVRDLSAYEITGLWGFKRADAGGISAPGATSGIDI